MKKQKLIIKYLKILLLFKKIKVKLKQKIKNLVKSCNKQMIVYLEAMKILLLKKVSSLILLTFNKKINYDFCI